MRWTIPEPPKDGDIRIKRKFALFPILIDREYRWLEFCYIEQKFTRKRFDWDWEGFYDNAWVNGRFVARYDYENYRGNQSG